MLVMLRTRMHHRRVMSTRMVQPCLLLLSMRHRRLMYLGLLVFMCIGLCPTWACVSLGR